MNKNKIFNMILESDVLTNDEKIHSIKVLKNYKLDEGLAKTLKKELLFGLGATAFLSITAILAMFLEEKRENKLRYKEHKEKCKHLTDNELRYNCLKMSGQEYFTKLANILMEKQRLCKKLKTSEKVKKCTKIIQNEIADFKDDYKSYMDYFYFEYLKNKKKLNGD